jgi:hypothetical protein
MSEHKVPPCADTPPPDHGTGDPCLIGPRCYGHPEPGEGGM